jgi:hypothetical protein
MWRCDDDQIERQLAQAGQVVIRIRMEGSDWSGVAPLYEPRADGRIGDPAHISPGGYALIGTEHPAIDRQLPATVHPGRSAVCGWCTPAPGAARRRLR